MKAIARTNANTIGALDFMRSLKSFDDAVRPVTYVWALVLPIVLGMTSSRSAASAEFERASVPRPAIGIDTTAALWLGATSTWIGRLNCPVASACFSIRAIARVIAGFVTSFA